MELLIIERDMEEINGIKWYLHNYVVKQLVIWEAHSASEAVAILQQKEIHVVIANMALVTPAVKQQLLAKQLTIIAVTAQPLFQHAQLAIELQAVQLLTKPVALDSLKTILLSIRPKKEVASPASVLPKTDLYLSLYLNDPAIIDKSQQQFFLMEPAKFEDNLILYQWLSHSSLLEEFTLIPLHKRIVCVVQMDSLEAVKKHCQLLMQEWQVRYSGLLNISIYDGEPATIRHMYEETKRALNQRFYKGYNQIFVSSEQIAISNLDPLLSPEQQQFWIRTLEEQNMRDIKSFLHVLTLPGIYYHQDDVRIHLTSVLAQIRRYMLKYHLQQHARLEGQYRKLFHIILESPILYEILQEMVFFIQALMQSVQNAKQRTFADLSELAIDYIHLNYADTDLSLTTAAKHLGISSSYLSAYFSKKQGVPFKKYVQQYRLQHAEKLLRETNFPIAEISALTGFSEANYFIKLFKQAHHQTPYQYRQLVQKGEKKEYLR